jgi:hypothetical protein
MEKRLENEPHLPALEDSVLDLAKKSIEVLQP